MPHGKSRPKSRYRLVFVVEAAAEIAARHGARTDADRARFFGMSQTSWSRLSRGLCGPGSEVIAAVLMSNPSEPDVRFDHLFRVVTEAAA